MLTQSHYPDPQFLRSNILPSEVYFPPAPEVAPFLLGKILVRQVGDATMAGIITETEAYQGEEDLGCHAKAGNTPRTRVMYGLPGRAYVYFTYGMHWMLNAVTCPQGQPAAVLIRSILPVLGISEMLNHRPNPSIRSTQGNMSGWTDGPAKLCQALNITRDQNDISLCSQVSGLFITDVGIKVPTEKIQLTPRIGLNSVPEPWKSKPWRWVVDRAWHPEESI